MTPSIFLHIVGTIFTLAISGASVFGQSHSFCWRNKPRLAAAAPSERRLPAMVWQTSLVPYGGSDARRQPASTEPGPSDVNPSVNSPQKINGSRIRQYGALPVGEQSLFETFRLSRRDETRPLFAWLPRWRLEADRGLFREFWNHSSEVAFAYSDISESRANPEKGGMAWPLFFGALSETRKGAALSAEREF